MERNLFIPAASHKKVMIFDDIKEITILGV